MTQHIPTIEQVSDQAVLIRFDNAINEQTADDILWLTTQLKALSSVQDLVPSYTTLLVTFDPDQTQGAYLIDEIKRLILPLSHHHSSTKKEPNTIIIPVYYGDDVGPDLHAVAAHCGLTPDAVIRLHSQQTYRAYAIGFTPGFSFLGNTLPALHIPRKSTPRHKVPKGSVAIAENQTAVYPSVTPGGWQIIGRTPTELINWQSENLGLIATGDHVRFKPISQEEFLAQGGVLDGF
ncbi:MAG: 5-oxoprolinase subunit PxpB [Marinomonas sp.]